MVVAGSWHHIKTARIQCCCVGCVIVCLPAETMEGALDKSEFMEVFYTECVENLIAPIGGSSQPEPQQQQQQAAGNNAVSTAEAAAGASTPAAPATPAVGKPGSEAGSTDGGTSGSSSSKVVPASTIGLIVDLLCFCVQHHAFWAKYHVLRYGTALPHTPPT